MIRGCVFLCICLNFAVIVLLAANQIQVFGVQKGTNYVTYPFFARLLSAVYLLRLPAPRHPFCSFANRDCFRRNELCGGGNASLFTFSLLPWPPDPPAVTLRDGHQPGVSAFWAAALAILRRSPFHASGRASAATGPCVRIPSVDHSLVNSGNDMPWQVLRVVNRMDQWNEGRQHMLFHFHDDPWPGYETGFAAIMGNGLSRLYFRPNYDVSLPTPPAAWLNLTDGTRGLDMSAAAVARARRRPRFLQALRPGSLSNANEDRNRSLAVNASSAVWQPRYVMTFKGRFTHPLRVRLKSLHDDAGGFVYVHRTNRHYDDMYLMESTDFVLCPRGNGLYSYRVLEAVLFGAIPVIMADMWALPLAPLVDWKEIAVVLPESLEGSSVAAHLRAIPLRQRAAMFQRLESVGALFFRSLERILAVSMELVRINVYGAVHVLEAGGVRLAPEPGLSAAELRRDELAINQEIRCKYLLDCNGV